MRKKNKPTVVVLMSTYNGASHLEEQIESIINQEDVNVRLIIRDDGSKDDTVALAKKYTDEVIEGRNLGYRYSFLELIRNAPDADYYALSDQDDIWLSRKLISATEMIKEKQNESKSLSPILYACRRKNYLDGVLLEPTELRPYKDYPFNGFNNGISLQGCTMVFNRELKHYLSQYVPVDLQLDHDTWINQVCRAIGGFVIFDNRSFLNYRIENNTVGIPKHRVIGKFIGFLKPQPEYAKSLCYNLLQGYGSLLSEENIEICKKLYHYKERKLPVLFDRRFYYGDLNTKIYRFLAFLFSSI